MIEALRTLGFRIEAHWPDVRFAPHGAERTVPATSADLHVANSGTTMRFLTALCSLGRGRYRLDGIPRMRERPIHDLLEALRSAGIEAASEKDNGCPPVWVEGREYWTEPGATVRGDVSSQFVSALLMIGPFVPLVHSEGVWMVRLEGPLVSRPYIEMTRAMMLTWNATWREENGLFIFSACESVAKLWHQKLLCDRTRCLGGQLFLRRRCDHRWPCNSHRASPEQPPRRRAIRRCAGADGLSRRARNGKHHRPRRPAARHRRGHERHQRHRHDARRRRPASPTGPTTIRNVAHIRHKETDRLAALATELRRVGADVDEFADGLTHHAAAVARRRNRNVQ